MNILMREIEKLSRYLWRRVLVQADRRWVFAKTDIVHFISNRRDLTNYLELCTSTTGQYYSDVMRWRFSTSLRLMYNCPETFDDGLPIDFKVASFDIEPALGELKDIPNKVDICLIDGFHTYECAIRDLTCAFELLEDGGVLVVHDCLPPSESFASPTWTKGDWAGVSYKAYLDFVLARDDLDYFTVDTDWGCGIIVKNRAWNFMADTSSSVRKSKLACDWFSIHDRDQAVFKFFVKNHKQLLRLVPAKAFVCGLGRNFFDVFAAGALSSIRPILSLLGIRGRLA
jgi:methyltransferase family protein